MYSFVRLCVHVRVYVYVAVAVWVCVFLLCFLNATIYWLFKNAFIHGYCLENVPRDFPKRLLAVISPPPPSPGFSVLSANQCICMGGTNGCSDCACPPGACELARPIGPAFPCFEQYNQSLNLCFVTSAVNVLLLLLLCS